MSAFSIDTNTMDSLIEIDPSVIVLSESDISDPTVSIVLEDICLYPMSHLQSWLVYRGDTLKGIANAQDARVRILQYFKLGTDKKLVDPTPDKIWLKRKASLMGLKISSPVINICSKPDDFIFDVANLNNMDGWNKSLDGVPYFSVNSIEAYADKITAAINSKCKSVKRHFSRGEQFFEENSLRSFSNSLNSLSGSLRSQTTESDVSVGGLELTLFMVAVVSGVATS